MRKYLLPEGVSYFRLTVVDEKRNHACTNAYFTDEL